MHITDRFHHIGRALLPRVFPRPMGAIAPSNAGPCRSSGPLLGLATQGMGALYDLYSYPNRIPLVAPRIDPVSLANPSSMTASSSPVPRVLASFPAPGTAQYSMCWAL